MENLWEMIAKARGVELGEEFLYSWNNFKYKYRIIEGCLEYYKDDGRWVYSNCSNEFIAGEGKIERLPFEPKDGDSYWTISCHSLDIEDDTWAGNCIDYHRKLQRLVFRTHEQAIKAKIEYIEKLKEIGYERG